MSFHPFFVTLHYKTQIMSRLAIVILNWNGAAMLKQYLPSVIKHSTGDVIVADNASTDDSVTMMQCEFPDTPLIILDKNYGFAEGYNRALGQLQDYDYFLLLNSDIEIRQPQWDSTLVEYMDTHPECAACQPKLLDLKRPTHFEYAGCAGGYIDKYGYPYCRGRIFATVEIDNGQYDTTEQVHWATGAALLCRATDWKASGGLDSRFFAHMEEIDLCWRLRIMGKTIACVPQSTAYHLGGATLNQGNPRKTYLNFRNNQLMLYKNLPESALNSTLRIRKLLDAVAALQFLLKGDIGNMKAVWKAHKDFKHLIPDFMATREHIQSMRKTEAPLSPISILWQYYVKGRKTWNKLIYNK